MSGGVSNLDKYINSAQIIVRGDTVLNAINLNNNLKLNIKVENEASLVLNMFDYANDLEIDLNIEADDNTTFIVNASFISEVKYALNIDTKIYGNNIVGNVFIRGINEETGIVRVTMNGTVAGETTGNVLNEYAKILNKSELSNVLIPNLIVNTCDVTANHGVTIGQIRDEELFYLMSKGISKSYATKMIEDGFLLSIMPPEASEKIKNILIGR